MKIEKSNEEYKKWLVELKTRIRQSQIKAAVRVNEELLRLYWSMGQEIVARHMEATWGSKFFERLSKDLRIEFPYMQGFSERNLLYIKKFFVFYSQENSIPQQLVAESLPQLGGENTRW
jgi:predicted nuclease of restriction endonuclease-like (RecB) superfamily